MDNKQQQARRKILKAAAISGGAVVGAKSLPNTWTQPVLNAVITPAHAQTSMSVTGVFSATGLAGPTANVNQWLHQPQMALLDVLVPQVAANPSTISGFCGDTEEGFASNSFDLLFQLNENGTVNIAMDAGFLSGSEEEPITSCSANSTITANEITDASINIGNNDENELDCSLMLSDMVASETEITGNWQFVNPNANEDTTTISCGAAFTATLGGEFPAAVSCAGQMIIIDS